MSYAPLISDAELLSMGIASNALAAIPVGDRDVARSAATALVYGYCAKRFKPPYSAVSDDVKRVTAHVATYDLLTRRGFNAAQGSEAQIVDRYEKALAWLRDVSRGLVEPDITDASSAVVEASPLVVTDPSNWDGTSWP